MRLYQTIADNWDAWKIELIELCPCASKMELVRREGEVIREKGTLNMVIPGRTKKKRREDEPEKIKQIYKKFHEKYKEKRNEYSRQYNEQNKEKCNEYSRQYYEQNKEKLNEQARQIRAKKKAEAQTQ